MKKAVYVFLCLILLTFAGCMQKNATTLSDNPTIHKNGDLSKGIINKESKDETEASFKPMVKINDEIYFWERDLGSVKLGDMELLGEIKFSKGTLSERLDDTDEDFSSNVYPVGAKVFRWDEKDILIASNDAFSICRTIE